MELIRINDFIWEIPKSGEMKVPARIYASEKLIDLAKRDQTLHQAQNVACLSGIQRMSYVMPDAHQGCVFLSAGWLPLTWRKALFRPVELATT